MLGIRNGLAQFKKTSKLKRKRNEKKEKERNGGTLVEAWMENSE